MALLPRVGPALRPQLLQAHRGGGASPVFVFDFLVFFILKYLQTEKLQE